MKADCVATWNLIEAEKTAAMITPVPGGVGSVTSAVLMKHVAEAAEKAAGMILC